MRSFIAAGALTILFTFNSHACDEGHTAQAIVDYVCDYSLVSNTQCRMWKEDMRQMNYNNQIIVDSFLGWDGTFEEEIDLLEGQQKAFAEQFSVN